MSQCVSYFFAPQSPWAYLGHERFVRMAREAGASVRVLPVDLGGRVFSKSGGLPLHKRAPQRQAYRLRELQRFSEYLQAPLNPKPKYFPVPGDDAARLIIAADMAHGSEAAQQLAGAIMTAVWVQERNIASDRTLAALLEGCRLPVALIDQSHTQQVQERYDANTQEAIDLGVFGAPSYVIDGEIFWGQDRLDFVQRRLLPQERRLMACP